GTARRGDGCRGAGGVSRTLSESFDPGRLTATVHRHGGGNNPVIGHFQRNPPVSASAATSAHPSPQPSPLTRGEGALFAAFEFLLKHRHGPSFAPREGRRWPRSGRMRGALRWPTRKRWLATDRLRPPS